MQRVIGKHAVTGAFALVSSMFMAATAATEEPKAAADRLPVLTTEFIPHAQVAPPGPPLAPAEAIKRMTVPDGFSVELVAAEPDLINPVAMTIDEKGRFWIAESIEYPRFRDLNSHHFG